MERPIRYLRNSFLYGRTCLSDADLNAQAEHWLATVANVRTQAATHAVPLARFENEERRVLQPLAAQAYHSLLWRPVAGSRPTPRSGSWTPERRGSVGWQKAGSELILGMAA